LRTLQLISNKSILTKELIKQITPPFLLTIYKIFRRRYGFFGVHSKYTDVLSEDPWSDKAWISAQKEKLLQLESSRDEKLFLPTPHLSNYLMIPCLFINLLSQEKTVNVLDHWGGTGLVYHYLYPYLSFPQNVKWSVLDGPTLLEIGKEYTKKKTREKPDNPTKINFISDLQNASLEKFDIVYVNSSVQYYTDYQNNLHDLIALQPKYFIFTRLMSGEGKTFFCSQKIFTKHTPCCFINSWEFLEFFKKNGYDLIFKSPNKDEVYGRGSFHDREFKNVPEEYQTPFSIHMVFGKKELEVNSQKNIQNKKYN
jgi:putative methyltransferase (TIGR04325 family)